MNIIITSEHRVGSRWLHYLLADLLDMSVSPEIDAKKASDKLDEIRQRFKDNRIVKFHHATPEGLVESIKPVDYKVIGVVRNPRDRGVSRAFHDFYHPNHDYKVKSVATNDQEAIKFTILNETYMRDNIRQQDELMLPGYSTNNLVNSELPYIWTCYEWMILNNYREVGAIIDFLGLNTSISEEQIYKFVEKHSFKSRSGRKQGTEKRSDTWRRKGIIGDWENWFTEDMVDRTEDIQEEYWARLKGELS